MGLVVETDDFKEGEGGKIDENSPKEGISSIPSSPSVKEMGEGKFSGKLVKKEDRSEGQVSIVTLKAWLKDLGGVGVILVVIFLLALANMINIVSSYWVSRWTNSSVGDESIQIYYISGYSIFIGVLAVISFVASFTFVNLHLTGTTRLHDRTFAAGAFKLNFTILKIHTRWELIFFFFF